MSSVFEYIDGNEKYLEISNLSKFAIKYYKIDPQSSIMKIALATEIIIDDIIRREEVSIKYNDLKGKISAITYLIPSSIMNEMTQIRLLRNNGAAHASTETGDKLSVFAESYFALSKYYEILVWYVNFGRNKRILFDPFSKFTEAIEPVDEKQKRESSPKIQLPKLYYDPSMEAQTVKSKENILLFGDEKIKKILKLFLTTNKTLDEIEIEVLGASPNEGDRVYSIISLYDKIGITNTWRRYCLTTQKTEIITSLNLFIESKVVEDMSKYNLLLKLLEEILD